MLSGAKPHFGLGRNKVSAGTVSPTVCGLRSCDERDGALTIDSTSAEARNAERPTPSGRAHPITRRRIPSLSVASESPPWPASPLLAGHFFFGTCRPNKEGVLNGPISKARKRNQAKGQRTLEPSSRQRKYIALPIISSVEHANPKQVKGCQQNNGPRASNPKQVIISGRRRGSTRSALRYSASLCSPRPVQRLCSPRPARRCAACHGVKRRDMKRPPGVAKSPARASHAVESGISPRRIYI